MRVSCGMEKWSDIATNENDPAILALSTLESNIDDDFLSKLNGAYSACSYFCDENEIRRKRQNT